jgi:endonuclease YncB( thermonuclease family)
MNPAVAPTVAIVLSVTDGDSVRLRVPDWAGTPFGVMTLREIGVDTPESIRHVAKCDAEAAKGLTAKAYGPPAAGRARAVHLQGPGQIRRALPWLAPSTGRQGVRTGHGRGWTGPAIRRRQEIKLVPLAGRGVIHWPTG